MVDLTGEEEALIKDIWDNSDTNVEESLKKFMYLLEKKRKKRKIIRRK